MYRHVVLLGLMGAGKTAVGQSLARQLGWRLSDSDEQIQLSTGKTVRQLRAEVGVDGMHSLEAEHLLTALADEDSTVIGAAASVVDDVRCRKALSRADVATVWLRASPVTLAKRFVSSEHRPLFGDDPETFLSEQSASRSPHFAATSQIVIDVDDQSVVAVADSVWSWLKRKWPEAT